MDRGSRVDGGQLLVELSAPEMAARIAEVSPIQAAEYDRLQAEAQLAARAEHVRPAEKAPKRLEQSPEMKFFKRKTG